MLHLKSVFRSRAAGHAIRAAALPALACLLLSCGGGSVTTLGVSLTARFTPEQAAANPNSVSLRERGIANDEATLDVRAEAIVQPAFGTRFAVLFNPAVVEFVGHEPGDFFEQQADPGNVDYAVVPPGPGEGRLGVRITKTGAALGSQGDGVLIALRFRVVAVGSTPLTFDGPVLTGATGTTDPSVTWKGGRLDGASTSGPAVS